VQVDETEGTGEIDCVHDHECLRAGPFTSKPRTRDSAYRPEPGQMQDILSQEQTIFIEAGVTADKHLDGVF